jgi:iron(III) transport system ATP-binding protein
MTSVRVQGVDAGYGRTTVLADFNLEVKTGSMLAVLGSSGSGKTTLLRVLAGFIRPTAGTMSFGDTVILGPGVWLPPEKRGIGIVPQEGALFPHLDVYGNVAYGLRGHQDIAARVDELLELVGMSGFARRRPQELSGGQAQRVALARALAPRPALVLLDEPFSALDKGMRSEIGHEVRTVLKQLETTSILVTHDQQEALALADEVSVLSRGVLVQQATPHELYTNPVNLEVARFVGELVEFPASMKSADVVVCALGEVTISNDASNMKSGILGLRPEQLSLNRHETNWQVVSQSFHGHDTLVNLKSAEGVQIQVRVPGTAPVAVGDHVGVSSHGLGRLF